LIIQSKAGTKPAVKMNAPHAEQKASENNLKGDKSKFQNDLKRDPKHESRNKLE